MEQIDVKILDRDYRLAVSGETKPQLLEAVQIVDEKMRAIREAGRISGIDRIAVMAALQLAHELLGAQSAGGGALDMPSILAFAWRGAPTGAARSLTRPAVRASITAFFKGFPPLRFRARTCGR